MRTIGAEPTQALLDGRYRLGPCVGRGGTAVVYRAEDLLLGRTVAIKLLRSSDEVPSGAERAQSESAALAAVNHPSLVTLYDARLDPAHPRYLAMEYVDGPTLAMRLTHGPLSGPEAASLACDLAGALQAVHDRGIVHRDVKPSNVLLAPSPHAGEGWTAKLTDFGIAHGMDDARKTSPGIAVGTAAYMAPEQVRSAELTPAVDVYSLGLVLLEALTGEPAYPVTGHVQTALRRLAAPPEIPARLGPGWVRLLAWMTRSDPADRPTARDVAIAAAVLYDDRVPDPPAPVPAPVPPRDPAADEGDAPEVDATGPTQEYPVARSFAPLGRRVGRLRIAALAALGAIVLSSAALTGLWGVADPTGPPTRVATSPAPSAPPDTAAPTAAPVVPTATAASTSTGTEDPQPGAKGSGGSGPKDKTKDPQSDNGNGGDPPGK